MSKASNTETLAQFNTRMAAQARDLHDRMAAAGHPVTPEEAKFLLVAGWTALGDTLGTDTSCMDATLRRLASELQ